MDDLPSWAGPSTTGRRGRLDQGAERVPEPEGIQGARNEARVYRQQRHALQRQQKPVHRPECPDTGYLGAPAASPALADGSPSILLDLTLRSGAHLLSYVGSFPRNIT